MRQVKERRVAPVWALLCTLVFMVQNARGAVLATVRGVVHDASHRPIAGADIEIAAVTSQFRTKRQSDAAGVFEIDALPFGEYRITVMAPGFGVHQEELMVRRDRKSVV